MRAFESLESIDFERLFPAARGWVIDTSVNFPRELTQDGARLRCMDRRFGMQGDGSYDPSLVPLAPAFPGAVDGVAAFYRGNAQERMAAAMRNTTAVGFTPADHSDYGKQEGCAFNRALLAKRLPGLAAITDAEMRLLRNKLQIDHVKLHNAARRAEGLVVNNVINTTIMPDEGRLYVADLWFGQIVGISLVRSLSALALCGELLLEEDQRRLFIAA